MPETLIDIVDSGWLRGGGYGVVAVQSIWMGWTERRRLKTGHRGGWTRYWFTSALILLGIGLINAAELDDLVSQAARNRAWSGGWYRSRQELQLLVAVVVTGVLGFGAMTATRRIPPSLSRYLPHLLALSSLIGFLAIRIVSLHRVDAMLYRLDIAGIRIVAVVELSLLVSAWFAGRYAKGR